jgi:hypothetical protein
MPTLESVANNYALRVTDQATVYTTGAGDTTHANYQSVLGVPTFYTPAGVAESLASTALATFKDSIFRITGSADVTKIAAFEVDGFTTLTTRTFTLPNYDATLATLAGSEVLTNKTLTTPTIADLTNATHSHQNAAGGGQLTDAALSSQVTVPKGGTGLTTLTAHAALIGNGASAITFLVPSTARNVMISDGTDWASRALVDADIPDALTISGGTINNTIIGGVTPAAATFTNVVTTGYLELPEQAAPGTPTNAARIFVDTSNRLSWKGENGFVRTFDGTANTADRTYVLPNIGGTVLVDTAQIITTLTTEQMRLRYDASNYASFTVSSGGDLTIAPSGNDTTLTSTLTVNAGTTAAAGTISSGVSAGAVLFNLRNSAAVNAANTAEIDFTLESSTTTQIAASLTVLFSDTTNATRTSTITLNGSDSGTFAAVMTFVGRKATLSGSATVASAAGATWDGISFGAATATITGSTNITTATGVNYINIARPTLSAGTALTITNAATLYIANSPLAGGVGPSTITNPYSIWVDNGVTRLDGSVDTRGGITLADATNIGVGTGTGTKIGTSTTQKFGFWNATPIVQPTTAIAASTFVANTSGIANDTATFDGYTAGQVVKALRNMGILA